MAEEKPKRTLPARWKVPICKKIFLVDINHRRAESVENISAFIQEIWNTVPVEICLDINHAVSYLKTNGDGLVLGSSYLVGDVLKIIDYNIGGRQ